MNSPMITPIMAIVIAIFMPLTRAGSANGKLTITNDCHSDAVSERQSGNVEASVLEKPTAADITTGKKLTKAAKATRDSLLIPSQTTNHGASATLGLRWKTLKL